MDFERAYDVVVAGAGVAGVAAALECARAGLRTALIEKTVLIGGLATTGLVNFYLPLCDGLGHQVIYGIAEELLHLSIKYGPGDVPEGWRHGTPTGPDHGRGWRFSTPFSPASFVLALDEALVDAGVRIWLDTLVCAPVMEGRELVGLEVENKSGRGRLLAATVIDATGDADVAYRAGAACVEADNWLSLWALQTSLARARAAAADPGGASLLDGVRLGGSATGEGHPEGEPKRHGTDGAQVSAFVLEGRRLMRDHYRMRQAAGEETNRRHLFPITPPAMAQFRTTRRIEGIETVRADDADVSLPTAVGVVPDWRRPGPVWEIPYGAIVPQGVQRLLVVGRCISADREAWEVTRVIPPAALAGQVAGVVTTLALRGDRLPADVPVHDIQAALLSKGMPVHRSDIMTF